MSVLPLVPTDEEASLRESVAGICSRFGPRYMRECNLEEKPPRELWDALAEKGYLGANLPEEYGGGALGMTGLSAVGEEISAAGCSLLLIVVSPAIAGSILVRHGTPEQKEDWLPGIAAGAPPPALPAPPPPPRPHTPHLPPPPPQPDGPPPPPRT